MSSHPVWWKQEASKFLADVLAHVNQSRRREEPVDRCEDLCKALNKTWNAHYAYRRRNGLLSDKDLEAGRSDSQSFAQLLLLGLDDELATQFCGSESVGRLAEFSPHVMNHEVLLRRDYNPTDITEPLRKEASDGHRQLDNAYKRYSDGPGERDVREALLKKLKNLLYVIRCNIAHSEKTQRGPDPSKNDRDTAVSSVTSAVIEELFDVLLERPSQRLAVYGTLAPGRANAAMLSDLRGEWRQATVQGELAVKLNLPSYRWTAGGEEVTVMLLTSTALPDIYPVLDRFEGRSYARRLVPVMIGSELLVANIYEGVEGLAEDLD